MCLRNVNNVTLVVQACICLHNWLTHVDGTLDDLIKELQETYRQQSAQHQQQQNRRDAQLLVDMMGLPGRCYEDEVYAIRESIAKWFQMEEGARHWQ